MTRESQNLRQKIFSTVMLVFVISSVFAAGIVGVTGSATASQHKGSVEMQFDKVTDRVDRDGDGYVSSVTVSVNADTYIREVYHKNSMDIQTTKWKNAPGFLSNTETKNKGHPKFALFGMVPQNNKWRQLLLDIKEVKKQNAKNTETVEIKATLRDKKFQRAPQDTKLIEKKGIRGLTLVYAESDSSSDALVFKNVDTTKAVVESVFGVGKIVWGIATDDPKKVKSAKSNVLAVGKSVKKSWGSDDHIKTVAKKFAQPIKFEEPSEDRKKQLKITSNVNGATVKTDGRKVGTTPFTGQYPVDYTARNGRATVQVSADGYVSKTKAVEIGSKQQQTERFNLKKNKKELVVNATPSNASIYIDGSYAGNPPVKRTMWVKDSVDVWINASGYVNKKFEDVSPPRTIDWDMRKPGETTPGTGGLVGGIGSVNIGYVPEFDYTSLNLRGVF
ncbi:MAG: PEGA domain-containing protein, partial [Halobacteria archaeon]|nr:PEGA domain-containing protein [Halobacteria archaeon]